MSRGTKQIRYGRVETALAALEQQLQFHRQMVEIAKKVDASQEQLYTGIIRGLEIAVEEMRKI